MTLDVVKLVGCRVCGDPVIYFGSWCFADSKRLCGPVCCVIDDALNPGTWIDATEMMEGGSLHHRLPEIWND